MKENIFLEKSKFLSRILMVGNVNIYKIKTDTLFNRGVDKFFIVGGLKV